MLALDDTIERRWGRRIQAPGIYRDPVRSSGAHFVKTSGLRWMSLTLLATIPWAGRVWALPFLTALVSSERACRERGHRHKALIDVGRQMTLQVRRWLPGRDLVLVDDSAFSALLFLDALHRGGITAITRLRHSTIQRLQGFPVRSGARARKGVGRPTLSKILTDSDTIWQQVSLPGWYGMGERRIEIATAIAVWHHSGLPGVPIRRVLIRDPENRFEPQGLLCTYPARDPTQIVTWFVRRWQVEVTFQEARAHLGVETRASVVRQGHRSYDPCLLALSWHAPIRWLFAKFDGSGCEEEPSS